MRARRNWIPALAATTLVFGCQAVPGDVACLRAAGTAAEVRVAHRDGRITSLLDDARVRAHELMAKRTPAIK